MKAKPILIQKKKTTTSFKKERKKRIGISFPDPELNALYQNVREFVRDNLEENKIFITKKFEENGVRGEILTWCGTYRFKSFEDSRPWELFRKNFKTKQWESKNDITSFDFPHFKLLPILIQNRESSEKESLAFLEQSLKDIFLAAGFPIHVQDVENFAISILEKKGMRIPEKEQPIPYDSAGEDLFDEDFVIETHQSVIDFYQQKDKIMYSIKAIRMILIDKICGKTDSLGKKLKGYQKGHRGFTRKFWQMMKQNPQSFTNLVTMKWRDDVELKDWLRVSMKQEQINEIGQQHRGWLPFLNIIPYEKWNVELFSSAKKTGNLFFSPIKREWRSNNQPQSTIIKLSPAKKEEYAKLLLQLPVSLNHHLVKQRFFQSEIQEKQIEALEWLGAWQKNDIPTYVQIYLLRNSGWLDRLSYDMEDGYWWGNQTFSALPKNKKKEKYDFRNEAWMTEWSQCVKVMIDYYKQQTALGNIQKYSHPFWNQLMESFNQKFDDGESWTTHQTQQGFLDALPERHPWKAPLIKDLLENSISNVDTPLKTTLPKKRL